MAEVPSTFRLERGAPAPDFRLPDGQGSEHSLAELSSGKKAIVIAFVCNHCPFVIHLADALGKFAAEYEGQGVQTIAINANDVGNYPDDAPDKMVLFAEKHGWKFPYLYDATQEVALAYAAACTPDFYVFNEKLELTYAGQFDGSRPGRGGEISGEDLRKAVDETLATGQTSEPAWQPSSGCNIKWKPGNEPDYFL